MMLIRRVSLVIALAAAWFTAGCSGNPRGQSGASGGNASSTAMESDTPCACEDKKPHQHKDPTVNVLLVPHGAGYHPGTDPETLPICSHKSSTKNVKPDVVVWNNFFAHDTSAVLHFTPLMPFVGEDSLITLQPGEKKHKSELRTDLGAVTIRGWVTLKTGTTGLREASMHIMQGPIVVVDD